MATPRPRQGHPLQQGLFQQIPTCPRWEAMPEGVRVQVTTLVSRMLHAYRARNAGDDRGEAHDD
jgi:hypothetical protein